MERKALYRALIECDNDRQQRQIGMDYLADVLEVAKRINDKFDFWKAEEYRENGITDRDIAEAKIILTNENYHTLVNAIEVACDFSDLAYIAAREIEMERYYR